jgi:serine/threonine-protein kinase
MSMQPLPPGQIIAGRYRIQSVLGVGGHAAVYLAQQEGLQRKVAIKVLNTADAPKLDVLMKRFEQEARLISQLRDPHTITMYDFGQTPEGMLYMVQEYVEGEDLSNLFKREGQLEPERVVKIVQQLLSSLQEAHALGVLHRDIKPQNIMVYTHVGRRDQIKLLDFGIAKMAGESGQDWTAEGSLVGTPRYIAPERIRGKKLSPSSDIYAVGLVAYELLTGRRVMEGKKGIAALQSQLSDPSTKLDPRLPIPGALRAIVDRMMEKEVPRRYSTAEEVLIDLERWREPSLDPLDQGPPTLVGNTDPSALFARAEQEDGDPTLVSGPTPSVVAALRGAAQRSGTFPAHSPDRSYSSNDELRAQHTPIPGARQYDPSHAPQRDDATVPFGRSMRDQAIAQNAADGIANDATVVTTVSNQQIAEIEASVSQEFAAAPQYPSNSAPASSSGQFPTAPNPPLPPLTQAQPQGGNKALVIVVAALVVVAIGVVAVAVTMVL